jgi:hypothetical protein
MSNPHRLVPLDGVGSPLDVGIDSGASNAGPVAPASTVWPGLFAGPWPRLSGWLLAARAGVARRVHLAPRTQSRRS